MNNSNILEIVKSLVISEKEQNPGENFFKFWLLKNDKAVYSEEFIASLTDFYEGEIKKGFSIEDLKIEVSGTYDYICLKIINKVSQFSFIRSQFISYPDRKYFSKQQLLEADAPILALIEANRNKYLNNKDAVFTFLKEDKFLQNNLIAMNFDQETHDYVLNVKKQNELEEKAAKEAGKEELKNWALENGSDLLKLRIKHDQNWIGLAEIEFAIAHTKGFATFEYEEEDNCYTVKNATLEQLHELEKAIAENPDCDIDIIRCRWVDEYGEKDFRTFLRAVVKTPVGSEMLFKEITDVSEDDE